MATTEDPKNDPAEPDADDAKDTAHMHMKVGGGTQTHSHDDPKSGHTHDGMLAMAKEAEALDVTGDLIPLVEKALRRDGTIPLKIIQPGWGSTGYYPAAVLERDGPKVFTKGTKQYWDHPTRTEEAERPERSLKDLAAELVSDARYEPNGKSGPGLYADAKVFGPYKEAVEELAPHIGVSIRAHGTARTGAMEGRSGKVIESLVSAQSVDFVTAAGAGGEILQLFESARGGHNPTPIQAKESDVSAEELREAQTKLSEATTQRDQALTENARLREALILREARDTVVAELATAKVPDITRTRLAESLSANPPVKEDKLDAEALKAKVSEAVNDEIKYLAQITGSGQIRGMGTGGETTVDNQKEMTEAFQELGLNESTAKLAAAGRR